MWNVVAEPGAGKTDLLMEMVERKLKAGMRVLIIDPDGGEEKWDRYPRLKGDHQIETLDPNFTGAIVCTYDEAGKDENGKTHIDTFDYLYFKLLKPKKLRNLVLVLDDPNVYAIDKPPTGLKKCMRRKRQSNMPILITAHNWGETPMGAIRFIDYWVLGPTASGPEERSSVLKAMVKVHAKYKQQADAEAISAKKAGRYHKWIAFDNKGNPLTK